MKFFADTANRDELKKSVNCGIVDGVTANPMLVAETGSPLEEHIREICAIVDGDIGIVQTYRNYGYKTERLAASRRSPTRVIDSALAGADAGAIPFKALDMLFNHPLAGKGLDPFVKDCSKAFQEAPVAG